MHVLCNPVTQVWTTVLGTMCVFQVKKQSGDLVSLLRKVKEHLKPGDAGALAQLVTQFLNKHAAVTTETVVQEKMQYLQKKGGKSVAQALTYGEYSFDCQENRVIVSPKEPLKKTLSSLDVVG